MKEFICLFFLLGIQINLFSQNTPPYFPQEQLIHSDCDGEDPSTCLYNKVEKKVDSILSEAIGKYAISKDTLKVLIFFSVDKRGNINEGNYATINDSLLSKKIKKSLTATIEDFQPFEVINRKPKKYTSRHRLNFHYLFSKDQDSVVTLTPVTSEDKKYTGGQILEVPRYVNCNVKTEQQAKECFQRSIQNHIRKHFRYPEEAQQMGLQGKVSIIFTISKEGRVTNIRTRGPHQILENEARRITSLIPKMTPAKLNGIPVKIPFSIPITFTLR